VPERAARRGVHGQRATFALLVALLFVLGAMCGGPAADLGVRLRDDLGLLGLALASAVLAARPAAWVPVACAAVTTWFFGPRGEGWPPRGWAVLLAGHGSRPAEVVLVTCALGGAALFVGGLPTPRE
jgi:hypothetical protein